MIRIILPIPHRNVSFDGPTWYFEENIYLSSISDEDYSAFQSDDIHDHYQSMIEIDSTCAYIEKEGKGEFQDFAKRMSIELKFVMNNFASSSPIVFPFAASIASLPEAKIEETIDIDAIPNLHLFKEQDYVIRAGADPATISQYFKMVHNCCEEDPSLLFPLERYNSSLIRSDIFDQIVDLSISLEYLIRMKTEIRYRFSLHNSFVSCHEDKDRERAFELLQALYDVRSSIVHGDISSKSYRKSYKKVLSSWDEIIRIARSALNYYLIFVSSNSRNDWGPHVKDLIIHHSTRIVD